MAMRIMPEMKCSRCRADLDLLLQGHACGCPHLDYRGCECGGDEFPLCHKCREATTVIRPQIEQPTVESSVDETLRQLKRRIEQKGSGSYASKHEMYGILMEEVREFESAIHDDAGGIEPVAQELMDIAVVCLWGVACIRSGAVKNKRPK